MRKLSSISQTTQQLMTKHNLQFDRFLCFLNFIASTAKPLESYQLHTWIWMLQHVLMDQSQFMFWREFCKLPFEKFSIEIFRLQNEITPSFSKNLLFQILTDNVHINSILLQKLWPNSNLLKWRDSEWLQCFSCYPWKNVIFIPVFSWFKILVGLL